MQESIVEKSWPAGGISRIKVDSLFGNTRLVGYDGTEIKVSVSGRYYGWQQRAVNRNPLPEQDLFDISLEKEGNALVLKSAPRGLMNWLKTMGLDIRILLRTSKGYDTEIRSEAGSIEITNYLGEVQAGTKAGNITLENVRGEVNARTFAGSVKITDCKAEINVDTAAGNVTALRCEGNLHISTAGGTLRIDQVVGRVFAAATAGNIYASHIDGMLKASTTAGSCKVNNMKNLQLLFLHKNLQKSSLQIHKLKRLIK